MKRMMIFLSMLLSVVLLGKEVNITILGTSDVHGRMVPWNYSTDKADFSGSYSQISEVIKDYRQNNKNVIVVDIGDIIQDNYIEKFINEPQHPAMTALNEMKYDIIIPGNHEFNFGMDALNKVFKQFDGKVLSANIYYKTGERYLEPSTIMTVDGIKVGLIGATTPLVEQFEEESGNVKDMRFAMPADEIRKEVQNMKKQGADVIVLLAHMGLPNENNIPGTGVVDIANEVSGIDVIIAGHEHKNVSKQVVNGTIITEPYRYGAAISVVDLKFNVDAKGKKTLINKDAKTISVNSEKSDKKVEEIYAPYSEILIKDANVKVGETANDMVPQVLVKGIPSIYMKDSGLSTLFGDVQIYYSKADVVSFLVDNKKAVLNKGDIKKKDIANNYQYTSGETTVYELTGKDLKDYMEWSAAYFDTVKPGDTEYRYDPVRGASKYMTYDMFGGVKYKIDLREAPGNRIKDLRLVKGNKKVTDDMKIKVGLNAYRYEMLVAKGGPLEGRRVDPIWDSKTAFGEEEGTIRNMTIRYIRDAKKGKIDGKAHGYWEVIGIE